MRKKDVNMLSGSIIKGLLTISIPIMIMNVVQSLFNIIDMTILKSYDTSGGISIGAVGVCSTLITLITGLVIGVSTGANVVIAKNLGRKDPDGVDRAIGSSMAFSVVAGLALAVIGIFGAKLFLNLSNCPKELLDQAVLYFQLYFAGVPILMVYNFCASILRSTGDSRRPMIFLTIGGVVKVALTFLLVGTFHMGVVGVAVTTIVSWALSAALALWALIHNKGAVKVRFKAVRFYKRETSQILHIGIPAGLQQGLYSVANVIISATVNSFGPEATTGISIANNYDGILYQICTATALAVMPYVSQNIGFGNVKRAMQAVWKGILITVFLGATFGALSALFSTQLSSIMSSDPAVIAYSRQKMIIISSTYFICGINEIFGAALRGMGKPMAATVATLIFMCAIRFVWVYLIFPLVPNLTFLYLIWPIGWILSIITLLFVFFPTMKKLKKTMTHPTPAP
jgi:putative MATE family efflux protein